MTDKIFVNDIPEENRSKVTKEKNSFYYNGKLVYWHGFAENIPDWLSKLFNHVK